MNLPTKSRFSGFIKILIFAVAKRLGLFALCRARSKQGLRILCYHGIWEGENKHFSGTLFMSPKRFAERMSLLAQLPYPVVPLNQAVEQLYSGTLEHGATVITIDDGWYSTYKQMLPILEENRFPATVYVNTYFTLKGTPVTQLVIRYILKSTVEQELCLDSLQIQLNGKIALGNTEERETLASKINDAISSISNDEQQAFCKMLGHQLKVNYEYIVSSRCLDLMTESEIIDSATRGLDIQLHTHRHRISQNGLSTITEEITDNRRVLESLLNRQLRHFCYPSGIYDDSYWPELAKLEIASATTCKPGINYKDTHKFELKRYLDSENLSNLEFEAELSGFSDLLRYCFKWRRPRES